MSMSNSVAKPRRVSIARKYRIAVPMEPVPAVQMAPQSGFAASSARPGSTNACCQSSAFKRTVSERPARLLRNAAAAATIAAIAAPIGLGAADAGTGVGAGPR